MRYITYHGCRWYLIDLRARFEAKFQKGPGCWEWQGGVNQSNGYGRFYLDRLTPFLAHRLSWALYRGPLKLCVLHKCDNRKCVRPSHLFEGTRADNNRDMTTKGRHGYTGCKGMKHPRRKLDAHEVEQIRLLYSRGMLSQVDLGKKFGVTQAQISNIVRGIHWT